MILVDADSLVYKAGWSVEKRYYTLEETGEVFKTKAEAKEKLSGEGREGELPLLLLKSEVTGPESHAIRCLDNLYKSILMPFKNEPYVSYLSGPNNFRHEIAVTKPYKGNRSSSSKPHYYDMLRSAICEWFNGEIVDWIEADDRIAIEATADDEATIVGIDKDLLQIPGRHYNYDKGQFLQISDNEGWYNFFTQVLTGDAGDNIPGLPGVGRARSEVELRPYRDSPGGAAEVCRELYQRTYGTGDRFEEVCELLYLLRYDGDSWAVAREWVRNYG